jgi:hypothetical protein
MLGTNQGTGPRRSAVRWRAGATAVAAVALAVLVVLAPASANSPTSLSLLKGSNRTLSDSPYGTGCARTSISFPQLKVSTGAGGEAKDAGTATTCGAASGGYSTLSEADSSATLGVWKTVTLSRAASSLQASVNIQAIVSDHAKGVIHACPWTHLNGSYSNTSGNHTTQVWYNYSYSYCTAESFWEFDLWTEVYDNTTGVWSYGTVPYVFNQSGNYLESYNSTTNYSNPDPSLGWVNGSSSGILAQIYGKGYVHPTTIHWTPASYDNSSWASGNRITVYVFLYAIIQAAVQGEQGSASATILASGSNGHIDITSVTLS